nr:hypothetical protein [uncultured Holophaga sp.]
MAELLRLEGLCLESPHLRGVDWSLPRGAKAVIELGSAAASLAFLRLCAGVIDPLEGRVVLDGIPLSPHRYAHPFRDRGALAWVPPEGGLLANQTLQANVALPLRFVHGLGKGMAMERAGEHLAAAGLEPFRDHRPHAIPPQERWLGALVRALAARGELWLIGLPPGGIESSRLERARALLDPLLGDPQATVLLSQAGPWSAVQALDVLHLSDGTLAWRDRHED